MQLMERVTEAQRFARMVNSLLIAASSVYTQCCLGSAAWHNCGLFCVWMSPYDQFIFS